MAESIGAHVSEPIGMRQEEVCIYDESGNVVNLNNYCNIKMPKLGKRRWKGFRIEKEGKKIAHKRYYLRRDMLREMVEYKKATGDDCYVEFHQTTPFKHTFRYATSLDLLARRSTAEKETQTTACDFVESVQISTSNASSESNSVDNLSEESNVIDSTKACAECEEDQDSLWLNCREEGCDYWVHVCCLGFIIKKEKEEAFVNKMRYRCPVHNAKYIPVSSTEMEH